MANLRFTETKKGKEWKAGKYKIVHGLRYKDEAIVSDAVKDLGQHIYHCYDEDGNYVRHITEQVQSPDRAKKSLNEYKLSKDKKK